MPTAVFAFVYSTQLVGNGNAPGTIMQRHDLVAEIVVDDVPIEEMSDGKPSPKLLSFAETEFLRRANEHSNEYLIQWRCHFGSKLGPILSKFRSYAPG